MPYQKWFSKVEKKLVPVTEWMLFVRVAIFSVGLFFLVHTYIQVVTPHSVFNKATADTATILVGLSMVLSSICYFWNFADTKIIYRKHLGLVGFAFAMVHLLLSQTAFWGIFASPFLSPKTWPATAGLLAIVIFAVMTIISNQYSALKLGGVLWRKILRTGYIALIFVGLHIVFLKWYRWVSWWQEGPKTLPSMSLLVSVFLLWVILMRILLWWSLKKKALVTRR